jgi:uncharacterized membrane protein YfcA
MFKYLILSIIGACAGTVGAITGTSGSSVILPGLLISGVVPDYKTAVGTTLLSILPPVSLASFYSYWKGGKYQLDSAVVVMLCYVLVSFFVGMWVVKRASEKSLYLFSFCYSLLLASYFGYRYINEE